MKNKKACLAIIHLAKKQTGLTDELYRALLLGAAGVSSSALITTDEQFHAIMEAFKLIGFVKVQNKNKSYHTDFWRCTKEQRSKIEVLWYTIANNTTEQALRAFASRIAHVDSFTWLSPPLATKVILALRAMAVKKGLNPDTGEKE